MRTLPMMWKVLIVALTLALTTLGVSPAARAAAPAPDTGNYCSYSLSTHRQACFRTEAQLGDYQAAQAEIPLVVFYDWIQFNKGGGYWVYTGYHNCTTDVDNIDYYEPYLSYYFYPNPGVPLDATISSLSTYTSNDSHCDVQLFAGYNLGGGAPSRFISECRDLRTCTSGNWYNRARSFVLS